jgi:hypothetical protein
MDAMGGTIALRTYVYFRKCSLPKTIVLIVFDTPELVIEEGKLLKNSVFWDVAPCGSCKNQRLRGTSPRTSVGIYGYVPSSPILLTMMMEAISSSETSVLTRATRRNIPEDAILHSHRRENLKSYRKTVVSTELVDLSGMDRNSPGTNFLTDVFVNSLKHSKRSLG